MQVIRTIVWVVLLVALLLFSVNNWIVVNVKIWEGLILETRLPALVVIAFLLGLLPMWLLHLAARWRLKRRISALENTVRATTVTAPAPAPVESPAPTAADLSREPPVP
ncbi:MAG: DUF1049 domain-containing protein [Novosphingobium sp.]|nr:DUF1049 domain-containing protein [Novosphingobium sp.]